MDLPPIAATTVGSFPRPPWLARSEGTSVSFELREDILRQAQDDATTLVIGQQEQAGLDLITDGEQRRVQFINHILASWDGIDLQRQRPKSIRRRSGIERPVPTVTSQVKRRQASVVNDLEFAKSCSSLP